nr:MAG TPA: hypothetical protein [Caudoviricetes sp.]
MTFILQSPVWRASKIKRYTGFNRITGWLYKVMICREASILHALAIMLL